MSFLQAAFLDLRLADTLGQLLGRLVPVLGQGADAGSLCTMVLEAILTLQDPENCLNPMAPAAQRVPDETPTPAEVYACSSSACIELELVAACYYFSCAAAWLLPFACVPVLRAWSRLWCYSTILQRLCNTRACVTVLTRSRSVR